MASNGLEKRAIKGKCRICQRVRFTDSHVKAVGEVRHGFATGYIWECINQEDCYVVAQNKIPKAKHVAKHKIITAIEEGNYRTYRICR